jgi:hypothetical protein
VVNEEQINKYRERKAIDQNIMAPLQELLLNPKGFFEELIKEEVSLKIPLVIVLILGIISGISAAAISGLTIQLLPSEMAAMGSVITAIGVVGGVIGGFLMYLIWTVIFYGISALFKGQGTFKRTLQVVGYGMFPQIFGGLISTVIIYVYVSGISVPEISDPALIEQVLLELMASPMLQLASLIGMIFLLWSASIWIFGIQQARNLTQRDAIITVGVPVAIYLVYTIIALGVI